jgi:hypothetical protein
MASSLGSLASDDPSQDVEGFLSSPLDFLATACLDAGMGEEEEEVEAGLSCIGSNHDFRVVSALPVKSGMDPAIHGQDAFSPPCPRCGCKHTTERPNWTPPRGECPAAALAKKVRLKTKINDPSQWPQGVVCMLCPLCGVNSEERRPCPTGPSCAGHKLGDFVCQHPRGSGDNYDACAPCTLAGKNRPCPCDICLCARSNLRQHPTVWRLDSYSSIKQKATRRRDNERLDRMLPSISQRLAARGVKSPHVQAAVARAVVDGSWETSLTPRFSNRLGQILVDENSSPGTGSGKCAPRVRVPCCPDACRRRNVRVRFGSCAQEMPIYSTAPLRSPPWRAAMAT